MNVIIAARLSQKQRNGRQGIGIDTQDDYSREWCTREGHNVVEVVADTKSGTVAPWDRPHLKPWVTDPMLMARYDAIVAYHNDRLSRGGWSDEARIRMWAEENNKRLIIVNGPQWPPRHDGDKWQWEAMATQARKEWEADRERSMRAQQELRDRGMLVGRAPFGYTIEGEKYNRRLVPTEQGRKYIPLIFQHYVNGWSLADVCVWLTQEGVLPASGKMWWPDTIHSIMRNPVYIGRKQDASGKTIHRCEPLVDAGLFGKARAVAADKNRNRGKLSDQNVKLLAPRCPNCRWSVEDHLPTSPMYRKKTQYLGHVYRCDGRGPFHKGCGNMVDLAITDRLVTEFLTQFDSPIMETRVIHGHSYESEIEEINFELRSLPDQGLSEEEEDASRAELRAERKRLLALPPVPDHVDMVDTGRTYGEEWKGLSLLERRDWLTARGIRCYPAKTRLGTAQAAFPALALRALGAATLLEGDGVSVVLTWVGSGIDSAEEVA